MSECRDLLFHVQEHCHRLPEIARFINDNDLQFLGFELSVDSLRRYQARFPQDQAATDLEFWHIFESANPDSFLWHVPILGAKEGAMEFGPQAGLPRFPACPRVFHSNRVLLRSDEFR